MPPNLFGQLVGELTPEEREELKRNWRMDSDQSHAYIIIYPIRQGDGVYYNYSEGLEIKPYPNPFSFGGFWGMGSCQTKEEAEKQVERFLNCLVEWKDRGLEKIEVKWESERTLTEVKNEAIRRAADKVGKEPQLLLPF